MPSQRQLNLRQRILVVEGDENIRRLNTEVLANSGYKVDAAVDGAIAWDTLQLNHYDLLVTGYNMPGMSGIELLKNLHAARIVLQVLMVSGTILPEKLKRHPWLQIDATLLKPYAPDELAGYREKSSTGAQWRRRAGRAVARLARPANGRSFPSLIQLSQSAGWSLTSRNP
jgi:two-component system chemotaxis response regulator CheY